MSAAPRTVRGNRLGLGLAGLVVTAAGVAVLVRVTGTVGARHARLLTGWESAEVRSHDWLWWVVAAAALAVVALCLRWLAVQLRSGDLRLVHLEPDRSRGETRLLAGALTDAVAGEIRSYPGVLAARAELTGSEALPELRLVVTVDRSTDLDAVRRAIHDEALAHVRQAVDLSTVPLYLELAHR